MTDVACLAASVGAGCLGHDDINVEADEFGGNLGVALGAPLRPAILDRKVATIGPSQALELLLKCLGPRLSARIVCDAHQYADPPARVRSAVRARHSARRPHRREA